MAKVGNYISTSIAAGVDDLPCFIAFYFYDPNLIVIILPYNYIYLMLMYILYRLAYWEYKCYGQEMLRML